MAMNEDLKNGVLFHQKKAGKTRSIAWDKFDHIFSTESKEKIKYFFYCTQCSGIEYNPADNGNTNKLLRHVCNKTYGVRKKGSEQIILKKSEKENFKTAAANYVAKDLRPYFAIQGEGLLDLCYTSMRFGQANRRATKDDLVKIIPSRNTVKDTVTQLANNKRGEIGKLMKRAILSGGIAATTDTWSDNYRHMTYLCVVAHIAIEEKENVKYHRVVLSTHNVDEVIKTGI